MPGKFIDKVTAKFLLVGIINTVFGTTVMFLCYNGLQFSYWVSSAANYILGSILSYCLNKHFTFRVRQRSAAEVGRFTLNIVLCYLIAYGAAKPFAMWMMSGLNKRIQENVAMLIGMCLFVGLNYIGQRYFVFTGRKK